MKTCSICYKTKEISSFTKNKTKPDGINNECRSCYSVYYKTHYRKTKKTKILKIDSRRNNLKNC